jgi:hypothetical protein
MALEGTLSAFDDLGHGDTAGMMCGAAPDASAIREGVAGSRTRQ